MIRFAPLSPRRLVPLCAAAIVLAGCREDPVSIYETPRQTAASAPPAAPGPHAGLDLPAPAGDPHAGLDMARMATAAGTMPPPLAASGFTFETPEGWQPQPASAMRVASFRVPAVQGRGAEVSVTVLAGPAGGEAGNVNRWRGQIGLPPVDAEAIARSATVVEGAGTVFRVFDLESAAPAPEDGQPTRMLAAILPRSERTWFVKMTGAAPHVAGQREAFARFLRSLQFAEQP
jgi:hypothetical protein